MTPATVSEVVNDLLKDAIKEAVKEGFDDTFKQAIKEAVATAMPKRWLSKQELINEFNIKSTSIWKLTNDPLDPLPFSTFGDTKQMFDRQDVDVWLERRKRHASVNNFTNLKGKVRKLTSKELAELLQGHKYQRNINQALLSQAKEGELIIVYGHETVIKFDGFFQGEIEVKAGEKIKINKQGIQSINNGKACGTIEILRANEYSIANYYWSFKTDIPHVTFETLVKVGKEYCLGMVMNINDLPT